MSAIALLALALPLPVDAQVPPPPPYGVVYCSVGNFVTPVRAEGLAELIGDLTINCNTFPGPLPPFLDLSLTLNTNITNNRNFGMGSDVTDAVAFYSPVDPAAKRYGRITSDRTLVWTGIPVEPPGSTGTVLIRIGNIRAKAFGIPGSEITVVATVSAGPVPVQTLPPFPVTAAFLQVGLGATLQPGTFESFRIRVQEGYPYAFKRLGVPLPFPGTMLEQEAGVYTPGSGVNDGGATQGTRLHLRLTNPPNGARVLVPHIIQTSTIELRRVFNTDVAGAGGCVFGLCPGPLPVGPLGPAESFGTDEIVVYEVTTPSVVWAVIDVIDIPVAVCQGQGEKGCNPTSAAGLKKLVVRVSLAPLSTVYVSDAAAPEPRFNETGIPLDVVRFP